MPAKNQIQQESTTLKAFIGIGNPSDEYINTYHNVGMHAYVYIKQHFGDDWTYSEIKSPKKTFSYQIAQNKTGKKIYYITSNTFMNESGNAIRDALSFLKILPTQALILHDDSDQTIGSYKISYNQRSAGHRGIESTIQTLGSQEFWRGKIGIRPQQEVVRKKALAFVLKKITQKDKVILETNVFPKLLEDILQKI